MSGSKGNGVNSRRMVREISEDEVSLTQHNHQAHHLKGWIIDAHLTKKVTPWLLTWWAPLRRIPQCSFSFNRCRHKPVCKSHLICLTKVSSDPIFKVNEEPTRGRETNIFYLEWNEASKISSHDSNWLDYILFTYFWQKKFVTYYRLLIISYLHILEILCYF